jgi:hypothetical protein
VERPRRKERFARLIQRRGRDVGVPSARAAFAGNLSPPLSPPRVVEKTKATQEESMGIDFSLKSI